MNPLQLLTHPKAWSGGFEESYHHYALPYGRQDCAQKYLDSHESLLPPIMQLIIGIPSTLCWWVKELWAGYSCGIRIKQDRNNLQSVLPSQATHFSHGRGQWLRDDRMVGPRQSNVYSRLLLSLVQIFLWCPSLVSHIGHWNMYVGFTTKTSNQTLAPKSVVIRDTCKCSPPLNHNNKTLTMLMGKQEFGTG